MNLTACPSLADLAHAAEAIWTVHALALQCSVASFHREGRAVAQSVRLTVPAQVVTATVIVIHNVIISPTHCTDAMQILHANATAFTLVAIVAVSILTMFLTQPELVADL